ncbi:hypothetical protein NKH73_14025 [Mesorhizobium sp. M0938]|uniref:hypothetical protein n=1 Tax=unclassified Mesorhizobium TaxID=325217 RepID=UPI0033357865
MSVLTIPSQIAASGAGHAQTDLAAQSGDKSAGLHSRADAGTSITMMHTNIAGQGA